MKLQSIANALMIGLFPVCVYATDIHIVNNTGSYATGSMVFTPCSSVAGDSGVLKPHGTLTVSSKIISTFCGSGSCDGDVYMTKNCSGKKVAKVKVSSSRGVYSITTFDNRYVFSGSGFNISVNPG